jgi:hypothetical protein
VQLRFSQKQKASFDLIEPGLLSRRNPSGPFRPPKDHRCATGNEEGNHLSVGSTEHVNDKSVQNAGFRQAIANEHTLSPTN